MIPIALCLLAPTMYDNSDETLISAASAKPWVFFWGGGLPFFLQMHRSEQLQASQPQNRHSGKKFHQLNQR